MHTWTRTAAPEQQVLILRSTAYQAWIFGLSSTIGGRFCGPLAGQKQPASGPGGRCIASNSFTIWPTNAPAAGPCEMRRRRQQVVAET